MPYLVDRQRALLTEDIVAIIKRPERRLRSRVILTDNSLYQTLTRPATLMRDASRYPAHLVELGARRRTTTPTNDKEAAWRKPQ